MTLTSPPRRLRSHNSSDIYGISFRINAVIYCTLIKGDTLSQKLKHTYVLSTDMHTHGPGLALMELLTRTAPSNLGIKYDIWNQASWRPSKPSSTVHTLRPLPQPCHRSYCSAHPAAPFSKNLDHEQALLNLAIDPMSCFDTPSSPCSQHHCHSRNNLGGFLGNGGWNQMMWTTIFLRLPLRLTSTPSTGAFPWSLRSGPSDPVPPLLGHMCPSSPTGLSPRGSWHAPSCLSTPWRSLFSFCIPCLIRFEFAAEIRVHGGEKFGLSRFVYYVEDDNSLQWRFSPKFIEFVAFQHLYLSWLMSCFFFVNNVLSITKLLVIQ
jgi:hypothetical protein